LHDVKNDPFVDSSRHIAIASAGLFLQINGHSLETSQKDFARFIYVLLTPVNAEPSISMEVGDIL